VCHSVYFDLSCRVAGRNTLAELIEHRKAINAAQGKLSYRRTELSSYGTGLEHIAQADANDPLPHGTVLLQILNKLIAAIQLGTTGAGGPGVPIGIPELTEAATLIAELNSNKYFIKKN
jgi:hypothetical protein